MSGIKLEGERRKRVERRKWETKGKKETFAACVLNNFV